jgi:hypothetical protein
MRIETLTEQILRKMSSIGKVRSQFFIRLTLQWIQMRGRYCFENLVRQGFLNAMSYRSNFTKTFDFREFNRILIQEHTGSERLLAFDPCFISKSGKHTAGIGRFWSGCAQSVKRGLEICCLAVADVENHTAWHYHAVQTILKPGQGLMDFYIQLLVEQASQLLGISPYLAVDAYFAKFNFVQALCTQGLQVITRLRDDAALWYPYLGPKRKGPGRPTKYAGKVKLKELDSQYFTCFERQENYAAYEAVLHSKSLKRLLRVVVVHYFDAQGGIKSVKTFACTETQLTGCKLWQYYRLRFHQEFLFRDAKQFLGLAHCQSRQERRLSFHHNFCLTVLSLAKVAHWLTVPRPQRGPFSIQDIKTQYFNEHLLDKFISGLGICPETVKNSINYRSLINYAKIAA